MNSSMKDVNELIREAQQLLRSTKAKICKSCKKEAVLYQNGNCKPCHLILVDERIAKRQATRNTDEKTGYVRVYDENDKLVLEHRLVMERELGRKLRKNEVVLHRDLNNSNNNIENLMLGFKGGTPLELLNCTNCNHTGKFEIIETSQPEPQ